MTGEQQTGKRAKRSGGETREKAPRFNGARFVQYELDKVQSEALKARPTDYEWLFATMQEMIDDGYRFSFKWDNYADSYSVFIQPTDDTARNGNCILTGRGSSPAKCLKQALYKHFVCLDGDWTAHVERRYSTPIDD